jgi:DNA-binding GntR family transcriptional regulator
MAESGTVTNCAWPSRERESGRRSARSRFTGLRLARLTVLLWPEYFQHVNPMSMGTGTIRQEVASVAGSRCDWYVGFMPDRSDKSEPPASHDDETLLSDGRHTRHLRKQSLAQLVRERLLDDVVSGVHPPGSMVSLATLAERYGVSRTPVREALSVLEHDGLVTAFPYQGFLINSASVSDLKDLYLMREVVETVTARRAAERVTEQDLERLRAVVPPRLGADEVYSATYDNFSREFHLMIARLASSARLEGAVTDIFASVARLQFIGVNPPSPRAVVDDHHGILDALERRDADAAAELMHQHIVDLRIHAIQALIQ